MNSDAGAKNLEIPLKCESSPIMTPKIFQKSGSLFYTLTVPYLHTKIRKKLMNSLREIQRGTNGRTNHSV